MRELKLYHLELCPYCRKVRNYIKDNDLAVELVDIKADPKNQEELIKLGGKNQVPMLLIDGEPFYESGDIIEWLKENKK